MADLPNSGAFDMQARLGELALEMSILWLCGEDISPSAVERSTRSKEWKKARGDLGAALVQAQRVVGKRVKIGTIWVGFRPDNLCCCNSSPGVGLTRQPLFELGKTPLDRPMRTIRTFFAPLIDEALGRRAQGGTGAHLIDRLVHASDGRSARHSSSDTLTCRPEADRGPTDQSASGIAGHGESLERAWNHPA